MHIPLTHYEEQQRPWGNFKRFTLNEPTTVKVITVEPHQALSLQKHTHREEFWYVLSGSGTFTIGTDTLPAEAGKSYVVPKEALHRVETAENPLVFLEIAFGQFDEEDIIRLEDRYGRV